MRKTLFFVAGIIVVGIIFLIFTRDGNKNEKDQENSTVIPSNHTGLKIGDTAPDITEQSPTGEMISLSSLRGKLVLLDFWASWCPPCRMENPNLVDAWTKFNDKKFVNGDGFTIYSVSLDRSKEAWLAAIEQDKLGWNYHVSDLKYWNSVPAAMYQVRGIPANFLIDGDGVIIGKNLKGTELHNVLYKYLKK